MSNFMPKKIECTAKKIADKLGVNMHTIIIEVCVVIGGVIMIYRALTF